MKYIESIYERSATSITTKLSNDEEQKFLKRTKNENFELWFGDSKVLDSHKQPLFVYHGSNQTFDEFKFIKERSSRLHITAELGFWFTNDFQTAKKFGKYITVAFLSIENPKIYKTFDDLTDDVYVGTPGESNSKRTSAKALQQIVLARESNNPNKFKYMDAYKKRLMSKNIDGIIITDSMTDTGRSRMDFVCFYSNQIKSIYNKGTWDNDEIDIYK